ncbi:uncharacterized protein [Rutidosis leptorrhynchoides]|uniref:uncharacterized protein isoform X1 n=1 Tax=Rutidosis leptorrhynchoides TaxID=125765 RepID=UPI003A9A256C
MGKSQPQLPLHNNQQQQQQQNSNRPFLFLQCYTRIAQLCSFKCAFILLLTVSVSLFAVFSIFHFHHANLEFDANDSVKNSAIVQAYFRLEKPVSFLIPKIKRLEYDINGEIGVPGTQVAILSIHKSDTYNWTDVTFGVLSKPMNTPINPVYLSILRLSLIEIFTQSSNLTLTKSVFGVPSSFEILKFLGGITIIPKLSPPAWMLPQVLFSFSLHNNLHEIEDNFLELKEQLKSGLQLMPDESVFVQVTNRVGSTQDPPVTVQVSVIGNVDPQRLNELARQISGSHDNLGLDNYVFGKVKDVSLSSYWSLTLDAPTPSPAPSPNDHMGPTISPAPASSPTPQNGPDPAAMGPASCGGPSMSPGPSHHPFWPRASPPISETAPNLSPLPSVSYGSHPSQEKSPSVIQSSSSSENSIFCHLIWVLSIVITLQHILH